MRNSDRSYSQDSFQRWLRERFTFDQEDLDDITQSIPPFNLLDLGYSPVRSPPNDQQVPAQASTAMPSLLDCLGVMQTAPADGITGQGLTTTCSQACSQPQGLPWLLLPSVEQQHQQWHNEPAQTLGQLPLRQQQQDHLSQTSAPVLSTDQQNSYTDQHGYRSPVNLLMPDTSSSAAAAAAAAAGPAGDQLAQLLSGHAVQFLFQPPGAAMPATTAEFVASTAAPAARAYDAYNPANSVQLPLHIQHNSLCLPAPAAIPSAPAAVTTSKRVGSDSGTGPDSLKCLMGSTRGVGAGSSVKASAGSNQQRILLTTAAQRRAHQRYRQRRKEKIGLLESELSAKQSTLQALQQEHLVLKAKARALDQLVSSAGDDMALIQELQHLTLQQQQQQQQQQPEEGLGQQQPRRAKEVQGSLQCLSATCDSNEGRPSAAAAAAVGSGGSPASNWQVHATAGGISDSNGNSSGIASTAGSSSGAAGTPKVGSAEYLQAALSHILAGANSPGRLVNGGDRPLLTGPLEALRSVVKCVVMEAAQLLLQIKEEKGLQHHHQQQVQQALGLIHGPPADDSSPTVDISNPTNNPQTQSMSPGMAPASCPALLRLHRLMSHARAEFRKFAVGNRVSLYQLYTLNMDTGELGAPAPPGHWAKVARVLNDRLPTETLSDFCVARQLYSRSLKRIKQQRQHLVLQLQQLLNCNRSSSAEGVWTLTELDDLDCQCAALLDAVERNLRREFALDGVFQWLFHKLTTPVVTAEILVHSWPYMIDTHSILEEVLRKPQNAAVVSAVQALDQQEHKQQS